MPDDLEAKRLYKAYKHEYKRCKDLMLEKSREGKKWCTFFVKVEDLDNPKWDHKSVMIYILDELKSEGIAASILEPNVILINWSALKGARQGILAVDDNRYKLELEKSTAFFKAKGFDVD